MNNQSVFFSEEFISASKLLKESWKIYLARLKTFLGIVALPVIFGLVHIAPLEAIFKVIVTIFSIFFSILVYPALIFSLKENLGIKESYQNGLKVFLSYLWLLILFGLLHLVGILLLIIPGIIFGVWCCLSFYVLVFEGKKGMKALKRSKELVSGRWWGVFWRLLMLAGILIIIVFSVNLLLYLMVDVEPLIAVVNVLLGFFTTPFPIIYGVLIYQNLARIKAEEEKPRE